MQQLLSNDELSAWGWRIPFLIGAACALFGLYLRRNLPETEEFQAVARAPRSNVFADLARHPKELLLVFGLTMGGTTAFYTFSSYMPTYLSNTLKLPSSWVAEISFISLFLFAAMQPLFGFISDSIGRKPVLLWFGILGTLCTVPILTTLGGTHSFGGALLLMLAALLIVSGYTSINAVVKAELFPANIRALGVGVPYCHRRLGVRRHRAADRAAVQAGRTRGLVLLVCDGADLPVAAGLRDHARHQEGVPHGGGWVSAPLSLCDAEIRALPRTPPEDGRPLDTFRSGVKG